MTVPPTTEPLPISSANAKPNWIQEAEAIAKADINRLEGKFSRVCNTAMGTMIIAFVALGMALLALFRSCR